MKKWICIAIAMVWGLPQYGQAQFLSVDNLAIHAGVEYPVIYVNSIDDGGAVHPNDVAGGNRSNFTVRPHASISYSFPVTDYLQLAVYSGYSQLGGNSKIARDIRQKITLHAFSIGMKGLYNYRSFRVGPVFGWNKLTAGHYFVENKSDGQWNTAVDNDYIETYLAEGTFSLGVTLQRRLSSHLLVSFESLYSLNDVFINEYRWPEAINIGDIQWYPSHYRLSVGYSF